MIKQGIKSVYLFDDMTKKSRKKDKFYKECVINQVNIQFEYSN